MLIELKAMTSLPIEWEAMQKWSSKSSGIYLVSKILWLSLLPNKNSQTTKLMSSFIGCVIFGRRHGFCHVIFPQTSIPCRCKAGLNTILTAENTSSFEMASKHVHLLMVDTPKISNFEMNPLQKSGSTWVYVLCMLVAFTYSRTSQTEVTTAS